MKIVILDDWNRFYQTQPGLAPLRERGDVIVHEDHAPTLELRTCDACPIIDFEQLPEDQQARMLELERQLEAQRRVNEILVKRIAKSVDIENGGWTPWSFDSRWRTIARNSSRAGVEGSWSGPISSDARSC